MKKRKASLIAAMLAAISFIAIPLPAADLTLYIGGLNPGPIDYYDTSTALDNSSIFGFRFSTNFVPSFGMEHTLAFSSDFLFPSSLEAITDANGIIYNSNLIFNVPVGKVVPYVTAGAGLISQFGDDNLPVGTSFAFNYGGGLKFPRVVGPLGLRFDMRGYRAGSISNPLNMFEVSGGVLISLGH